MNPEREEIYRIEPTADLDRIKERCKDLEHLGGTVKYLQIKGGNEEFYDKYGPKILKRVIDQVLKLLALDISSQILFYDITGKYGDIYTVSKKGIGLEKVMVLDKADSPLEVELEISEINLE